MNFTSATALTSFFCCQLYKSCVSWISWSKYYTMLYYTIKKKTWRCLNSVKLLLFLDLTPCVLLLSFMSRSSFDWCWKVNILWFWSELHPTSFSMVAVKGPLGSKWKTSIPASTKDMETNTRLEGQINFATVVKNAEGKSNRM